MLRKTLFAPLLAASAIALAVPAHATDREDRARVAIAAAEAKIQTAERLGANTSMPDETAEARAALAMAREKFKQDKNSASIEEALRAQSLAEAAIGRLENNKQQAIANERADANAEVSAANQQASDANARAASAEQSAAVSAVQAQAAREQAAAAQAQAQVETTVTTQQPAASAPRRATRTVKKTTTTARRAVAPTPTTTTTTTIKQGVN